MAIKFCLFVCVLVFSEVFTQKYGSGTDGNLRLCLVEKNGDKRSATHCPVLERENSGIECVLATDRLDCLRRIGKGTVDFGVFRPEDLLAGLWADVDILVTNQKKMRAEEDFELSLVGVIARDKLMSERMPPEKLLQGSALCHPGQGPTGFTHTLANYLESLVTVRSCDVNLSMAENRIKATLQTFPEACKAGSWLIDPARDADLKARYPSLCARCVTKGVCKEDKYWGEEGALNCLGERAGDFTWSRYNNVVSHFGLKPNSPAFGNPADFAYLCRDGSHQPLENNTTPCVWLNKPWPIIVAKRKAAVKVSELAWSLTNGSVVVESGWHGSLARLLELNAELAPPLQPPRAPQDYLDTARGFREAYSQSGCNPSRHITLCTIDNISRDKCTWLAEAGTVYGAEPPLQCEQRANMTQCLSEVASGTLDAVIAGADWMRKSVSDFGLNPILFETTPLLEQLKTVVPFVRNDSQINKMADLRGKKAAFPIYDGVAWNSIMKHLKSMNELSRCSIDDVTDFFGDSCVPGIENEVTNKDVVEKMSRICYDDTKGEMGALRALIEGRSDVAFISLSTAKMYQEKAIDEPWAVNKIVGIRAVCPEGSDKYCLLSWATNGQVYVGKNMTTAKRRDVINAFKDIDKMFGFRPLYPRHRTFAMYGPYAHKNNILFQDTTRQLSTETELQSFPFTNFPMNYEASLNEYDRCHKGSDSSAFKMAPEAAILFLTLVNIVGFFR